MKIILLWVGKTDKGYLEEGIARYRDRLKHYADVEVKIIPELKNAKSLTLQQQKDREGEQILSAAANHDLLLLDEHGSQFSSEEFAAFLQKRLQVGAKNIVFAVGGPYGFSDAVYARGQAKIALSSMTFSHQMVRLFFVEQLYRAFTILRGEPYHHA